MILDHVPGYILIRKYSGKTLWHDCTGDVRQYVEKRLPKDLSRSYTFDDFKLTVWKAIYIESLPGRKRVVVIGSELEKVLTELGEKIEC